MLFKDYVKALNEILEKDPTLGELETIAAIDGEGNGFNKVELETDEELSVGNYDGEWNGEFIDKINFGDYFDDEEDTDLVVNAICIN